MSPKCTAHSGTLRGEHQHARTPRHPGASISGGGTAQDCGGNEAEPRVAPKICTALWSTTFFRPKRVGLLREHDAIQRRMENELDENL